MKYIQIVRYHGGFMPTVSANSRLSAPSLSRAMTWSRYRPSLNEPDCQIGSVKKGVQFVSTPSSLDRNRTSPGSANESVAKRIRKFRLEYGRFRGCSWLGKKTSSPSFVVASCVYRPNAAGFGRDWGFSIR